MLAHYVQIMYVCIYIYIYLFIQFSILQTGDNNLH